MSHYFYLVSLIVVILCLGLIDRKYKLAFFYNLKLTIKTLLSAYLLFWLWDNEGIAFKIFYKGESRYSLNTVLYKNFPIEELFFLFVLVYSTLIVWRVIDKYV